MFGFLSAPLPQTEPPKDVPPPTPVNFPHYAPELTANGNTNAANPAAPPSAQPSASDPPSKKSRLTNVLQSIVRPTELGVRHFEALGVRIRQDADPTAIIPNYHQHVPDFATWEDIPYDQARDINESTRRPISNGNRSPGIQIYLDRKRELSIDNTAAYRTVRRLQPSKPGQPPVRLGNAYEFYRHLDTFTTFWDDTSVAAPPPQAKEQPAPAGEPSDAASAEAKARDGSSAIAGDALADITAAASSVAVITDSESEPASPAKDTIPPQPDFAAFRSCAGNQMPPDYRLNMITAFLKLVAYDFGCCVTASRTEPRLYLNTGTVSAKEAEAQDKQHKDAHAEAHKVVAQDGALPPASAAPPPSLPASIKYKGPCSYFSSGCIFIYRSPTTREAARAGIVEGPLAAVSARHTTSFLSDEERAALSSSDADRDSSIDLARELVAALLTAQHRAREGRAERRIGKGEWWTTRPRWGGGTGGPIGREVDSAPNTDEAPNLSSGEGSSGGAPSVSPHTVPGVSSRPVMRSRAAGSSDSSSSGGGGGSGGVLGGGNPTGYSGINTLAAITGMPVPGPKPSSSSSSSPSSSSSSSRTGSSAKKQRKGLAIYDNYRMVRPPSSSWDKKTRYMAIGRDPQANYDDIFVVSSLFHHISIVRVRVPLSLLDELDGAESGDVEVSDSSLRGLEVVRSPWYDYFKTEDRLAAMRLSWGMMAYLMRKDGDASGDVQMKDA